jgi:hypothetical protein
MAEVPTFSNGKTEPEGGGGLSKLPLCTAAYDEATQAPRHHSHVCDLDFEHVGPHFCSQCGTHWQARTGVAGGGGKESDTALTPQQKQVALARMDATMVGTGFVMVTRQQSTGKYSYLRLNPEQIALQAPVEGWDDKTADDVAGAATEILRRRHIQHKLRALIGEGEKRTDRHKGWVHTALLKALLEDDLTPE